MEKLKATLGVNELKSKPSNIWKALLAEFLGNLLLNFFGCASTHLMPSTPENKIAHFVLIALTFGLTVFIVVQALGHISGAHINPAITAAMLITRNTKIIKGLLYIVAQCVGATVGSVLVKVLITEEAAGVTTCAPNISEVQGFHIELMLGFVLVLTVFAVCDCNRPETTCGGALAIGMAVVLGHLATIQFTGSSMNPARSFGAAFINGNWTNHWIYWLGPTIGSVNAALLYQYVFTIPSGGAVKDNKENTNITEGTELTRLDGIEADV